MLGHAVGAKNLLLLAHIRVPAKAVWTVKVEVQGLDVELGKTCHLAGMSSLYMFGNCASLRKDPEA